MSVSICVATVCLNSGANTDAECSEAVESFMKEISSYLSGAGVASSSAQLALHCIGEIGAKRDLSSHGDALSSMILSATTSDADEIRSAAAFCLGSMAVGN